MHSELTELIDLHQWATDQVWTLWNVYAVVTLGLVSVVLGASEIRRRPFAKGLLIIFYACFAVGNMIFILRSQSLCIATARAIASSLVDTPLSGEARASFALLRASPLYVIALLHAALDVAVIVSLWVFTRSATRR